jgi:PAS domain S-box-containing protein
MDSGDSPRPHCGVWAAMDGVRESFSLLEVIRDPTGTAVELRPSAPARGGKAPVSFDPEIIERCGEVAQGGPPLDYECQVPSTGRTLRVRAFPATPGTVALIVEDISDRKRADADIRESEERYRLLFSSINDIVLVHPFHEDLTPETLVEVNDVACERLGYTREELLRMSTYDLDAPEGLPVIPEAMARLRADGHAVWEGMHRSKDGRKIPVEISNRLFTMNGKPMILATIRDMSERKRMEGALRRQVEAMEALQSTLLEITAPHDLSQLLQIIVERAVRLLHAEGGGMYLCDPAERVVRCVVSSDITGNYVGTTLRYGEGAAGIIAQTGTPLLIDDYGTWTGRSAFFEEGKPFRAVAGAPMVWQGRVTGVIDVMRHDKGDSFSPADLELLSVFANHAAIAVENARLLDGLGKELAERKHLEAEREAATQRLEFVVGATRTGFDIIDANYVMHYIDPARMKIFGDFRGRRCYEYFRHRSSPCGDCAMIHALATHTVQVEEQTNPATETHPTQVTAIPYQTESGEWMVAEVSIDITERKQAEAARLEMERRVLSAEKLEGLGILAGGVAHNFNNLLAVMLGYAELLRDKDPEEGDFRAAVEEIIKAGLRSRDLIRQLLAMGRRQVVELVPADLNHIINDSRTILRQAIRENVAIEYRLSSAPCPVMADAGRIEQVLLNLALNAQDAILRDGSLIFETSETFLGETPARRHDDMPAGKYILLRVTDTGVGMDRKTMDRIFDPFFTTKEQGKGTGLGLSTVYGIVKQHGGNIEVESEPGQGSRFEICFPRTDAVLEGAPGAAPLNELKGTETILIVEDEDPVRELLCRQLRSLGYTVLEADGGEAALRAAAGHQGDLHLLLTDVILQGMNGKELCDVLSRERVGIKALYMSGYTRGVLKDHGVTGDLDLLQKPFDRRDLAEKVRKVLDRHA